MPRRVPNLPGPYGMEPWRENFSDRAAMVGRGWTLVGAPAFGAQGGMVLVPASSQYARIQTGRLGGTPFQSGVIGELTIAIEFTPTFDPADGIDHYFIDIDNGAGAIRTLITKNPANAILVYSGNTTLLMSIALATYLPFWVVGGKNLLVVGLKSGASWWSLNGSTFATSATAFTVGIGLQRLFFGASFLGASIFSRTMWQLMLFNRLLTQAEVVNLRNTGTL